MPVERVAAAERRELDDVAPEAERDRPVGDDADLAADHRQRVQVVRPRDEPAEEPTEPEARELGDPLVPPERRDLAEHAIRVRLLGALHVARQAPGLS